MNTQDWFPLGFTDLISLQFKGLSRVFSNSTVKSISYPALSFLYGPTLTYMTIGKNIALIRWTFVVRVMSLLFNMLSRLLIAFLQRSKCLLIPWLQSSSVVSLEPKKRKIHHGFHYCPMYLIGSAVHGVAKSWTLLSNWTELNWWDWMPWSLFFECWILSKFFHSPLSL